tara:strand:+ start:175 stop:897 length:723 start_codon:yes stop_codon:yes gene_type:complete
MKNHKKNFFNQKWYSNYIHDHYKNKDNLRDSILNKEVLFQHLARKKCLINSLSKLSLDKDISKIIDIGCGSCSDLINLVSFGFKQKNLYGVDINKSDIDFGGRNYPLLNLFNQDATQLNFESDYFDLTMESTMFVQITNLKISRGIANEMMRITKKKGYILLIDWKYGKLNDKKFLACDKRRVLEIFKVGEKTSLISIVPGMLVPPIGRFFSKNCSEFYFLIARLFPFFVGQVGYILIKN